MSIRKPTCMPARIHRTIPILVASALHMVCCQLQDGQWSTGDDANAVTLPFAFNFGTTYTTLYVVTNGYVFNNITTMFAQSMQMQLIQGMYGSRMVRFECYCWSWITLLVLLRTGSSLLNNAVPALSGTGSVSGQIHLYENGG